MPELVNHMESSAEKAGTWSERSSSLLLISRRLRDFSNPPKPLRKHYLDVALPGATALLSELRLQSPPESKVAGCCEITIVKVADCSDAATVHAHAV